MTLDYRKCMVLTRSTHRRRPWSGRRPRPGRCSSWRWAALAPRRPIAPTGWCSCARSRTTCSPLRRRTRWTRRSWTLETGATKLQIYKIMFWSFWYPFGKHLYNICNMMWRLMNFTWRLIDIFWNICAGPYLSIGYTGTQLGACTTHILVWDN